MTHPLGKKRKRTSHPFPPKGRKTASLLDGIPPDPSSLSMATRITQRVSEVGFDWPDLKGLLDKLDEEKGELREALTSGDRERIQDEIGDLLFVMVNLARWVGIDPDRALRKTIRKFIRRFQYIETSFQREGRSIFQSSLPEMEDLWEEAKDQLSRRRRP